MKKIVVFDYGSQYNHLITRRIRDLGVYSELWNPELDIKKIQNDNDILGIILSGGPNSIYKQDLTNLDKTLFGLGIPILGICYGMQLIASVFGAKIIPAKSREYGRVTINVNPSNSLLFEGVNPETDVFMSHKDMIETPPQGFVVDAKSQACPIAAFHQANTKIYGVQFHPEVVHTSEGNKILKNFVFGICKSEPNWSMDNFIAEEIIRIKEITNGKKVLLGLSGGVDSTVAAVLLYKAIGEKLTCMLVDHGLLRKDEVESVTNSLKNKFSMQVVVVDAKKRFLDKLSNVTDPEKKRKIIGGEFISVFDEESRKLGSFPYLAQGTLYTDIIESGTSTAATIKSHHNVGGLPDKMRMKLIEPLNRLYKDEVRLLGKALGLPEEIVSRQPFPGPGLAIRIMGEVTEEKLEIVRKTDWVLREEIQKAGLDQAIWQYFTVLTGVRTVGVMGDERTYDYTVAIRAVTSVDGMTADWAKLPYEVLDKISRRMVNEVEHVNRIVYDISSKPPATIEWE